MPESIGLRVNALHDKRIGKELRPLITALQADIKQLRAANATLTAKLDADAGVTDTNYTALCSAGTLNTGD
jgi:hypothetical protein